MIRDTGILVFICLICLAGVLIGADDSQISAIRAKAASSGYSPSSSDLSAMDSYFLQALDELLSTQSRLEAVELRNAMIKQRGWKDGMQNYVDAYNSIALKHLNAAIKEVLNWQDQVARLIALRNLSVLAGQLESIKMLDIATRLMDNQDAVVRYWAVKAVANSSVASTLNSSSTSIDVTKEVLSLLLKKITSENTPEVLDVIVRFGMQLKTPDATGLLIQICDKRIRDYENWTVRFEKMDAMLLKALALAVPKASSAEKGDVMAKFAQLYSYVIQRYIIGYDMLSSKTKNDLVSTIVEVEETAIEDLMGQKWGGLKKAIEGGKSKLSSLKNEHDVLLGSDKAGQLAGAIKFTYDNTPDTSPRILKSPQ